MTQLFFKKVTTEAEAELLRGIRNSCREYMTRHTGYITQEQQKEWFKTANQKYDIYLIYAIEHGVAIVDAGFGLIHLNENESLLTGGLLPYYRNRGLGAQLFKSLIDRCDKSKPIRLEVLKSNTQAIKTYEKLNFNVIDETETLYFMEYSYDSVI